MNSVSIMDAECSEDAKRLSGYQQIRVQGISTAGYQVKTEDGGQKTEVRRQRTEDGGQKTEDRRRRTDGGGRFQLIIDQ